MRKIIGALMLAFVTVSATPAVAAGFLQDLFSQATRSAAPPVVYRYAAPPPQMRFVYDEGLRVSPRPALARKAAKPLRAIATVRPDRKLARIASVNRVGTIGGARVPDRCKPEGAATAIERDPTLRVGDAYMTPQGLKVYRGFVDYKKAGIDRELRTRLDAVDQPSTTAKPAAAAPRVAATAYVTSASRTDRTSVDAHGRVIRVVGP
jgi:hypothetical protein